MMDATYWGRNFGVVVIRDHFSGRVVWHRFIAGKERTCDYEEGIRELERRGSEILCVVADGLKWLRERLGGRPFQLCQFHQVQSVRMRLTSRPKLQAAAELLELSRKIFLADRGSFERMLGEWHGRWADFLFERSTDADGRTSYTHRRLRSAYLSLRRNLPWLWTFREAGPDIPNTNNEMEALFSWVKGKLRVHRGMSAERRKFLISELFSSAGRMDKGRK